MTVVNWEELIKERLRSYDPNIETTTGSAADVHIIKPLVRRLSPGILETNISRFVIARLQQDHPTLAFRDGGILNDVLVQPLISILDGVKREIREVSNSQDLSAPYSLTTSDVDARLENLFFTRDQGAYATVRVRAYFQNPVAVVISSANTAYTASSLRFIPSAPVRFSATQVLLNRDASTGYYYVDASFRAERPGAIYSVAAGDIIGITGIAAAVRVTNLAAATPGRDAMTNAQFIDAARQGIGERSLNTEAGIVANVQLDQYPGIDILQVIGFNDPEMGRDVITGGSLGPVLFSGSDLNTSDDGDTDGYTALIDFTSFDVTGSFGPVGFGISNYSITIYDGTDVLEFELKSVLGSSRLAISDDYEGTDRVPDSISNATWSIRQNNLLTLSDIPGGILFPSSDDVTVDVPPNTIHVGSCTDIYVRGPVRESKATPLSLVADQEALQYGEAASVALDSDEVTLTDLTDDNWALIGQNLGEYTLYIESGPAGAYRILEQVGTSPYVVRVDNTFTAVDVNLSWVLVDDVDINLLEPKERRWIGDDLRTVAGIATVETVGSSPDFVAVGVVAGDFLRILNGSDAGEYEVISRTTSQVVIDTTMSNTASPLNFEIYRKQDGIELPLVRVTQVELLDGDLEPTGDVLPYRHPIDAQSRAFQNPGRGPRAGTDASVTGDLLDYVSSYVVQSDDASMNFYAQGLRPGDILNINSSDNQGYYVIEVVGGDPSGSLSGSPRQLQLESAMLWNLTGMEYEAGPPSYGSFRVFFLDPTSFEVDEDTVFSVVDGGITRTFRPDPELFDQFLPTAVSAPTAKFTASDTDLVTLKADGTVFDNQLHNIVVGDRLRVTYGPIVGSANISSTAPGTGPVTTLDGATILIDVGGGAERITFEGTSLSADDIVSQINEQLSRTAAYKWEDPGIASSEFVMLRGDFSITILDNTGSAYTDGTADVFGTNRQTYNPWLTATAFAGDDTSNASPIEDYYYVETVSATTLGVKLWPDTAWTGPGVGETITQDTLGHYFRVERPGRQRISSTAMAEQQDEHDLYWFDVECVSIGHGDPWNIEGSLQATVTGYRSEGWSMRTEDEDTSFSMAEVPWMDVSPNVLIVGEDYDQTNKLKIVGRSIQVVYERDDTVEQVHDYVREPSFRVTCNNPLARSLLPVFVRTNIEYAGGGSEKDIRTELITLIKAILPENELEVSDMEAVITRSGSTSVTHPITLIGVAWQKDRSLLVERSVDAISSSRLYGLLPDVDDDGNSLILLTRQPVS